MAMGTRKQREKQEEIWIAHQELVSAPRHPFYQKLNELLEAEGFDEFVEGRCAKLYAAKYGRPSPTPGVYFRSLLIGYFEGIDGERGIAWRLADSLALRRFVGITLDEKTPDLSTISHTRRLIDLETHREVFGWILGVLADSGLLKGKRVAIDATTLEANAAMRSIVQRFPSPDPLQPIPSHIPTRALQQHRDPAIAITAILAGQLNDNPCQRVFILALRSNVSLRPSPLPQQPAGMPLRYSILLASMFDRAAPPFKA